MVQEITTKSWGSRIMNAFVGILVGIALIIGSFILIFWNEGNSLGEALALQQAQKILITIPASPVNEKNNLSVVYLTGLATTEESLHDPLLNITAKAIKLDRKVEMYQWQEDSKTTTEKEIGGSEKEVTTYTYNQVWADHLISSSKFKEAAGHQNPDRIAVPQLSESAEKVTVGDFYLPKNLIDSMNVSVPVDLSSIDITHLQKKISRTIKPEGNDLYLGEEVAAPKIGDIRVSVSEVLPQTVSIIAQQTGNTLQPFKAPSGHHVSLLSAGVQSPDQMIEDAQQQNRIMAWILRAVSLFMMIMGFVLIMKPLSVLADVIPFLGNVVGIGTGLIAVVVGLLLWMLATAIAWITVRPLWATGLIILVLALSYAIFAYKRRHQTIKSSN